MTAYAAVFLIEHCRHAAEVAAAAAASAAAAADR
jgi:hypothetical protein